MVEVAWSWCSRSGKPEVAGLNPGQNMAFFVVPLPEAENGDSRVQG